MHWNKRVTCVQVMAVDGFTAQKGDDEMEKLPDNLNLF